VFCELKVFDEWVQKFVVYFHFISYYLTRSTIQILKYVIINTQNLQFKFAEVKLCRLYNGLEGGQWNFMEIAQIVALIHVLMALKSFYA
jgi:hypothetical protein